jgi:hypothetical protein
MEQGKNVSRRAVLRTLGLAATGLIAGACTPLRIVTGAFPEAFKHDSDLVGRALGAFALAVIPGAGADSPNLGRALLDPSYPFASYAEFFAADLSRRARARFGEATFDRLSLADRTAVIRDGLAADATTRKLYQGAIYLTQIAFYGGIHDDERGCALIDFPGSFRGDEISYEDGERFLPPALTATGNYA